MHVQRSQVQQTFAFILIKEDVKKKRLPAARGEDAGVVTYIQPHLILRGATGLVALARQCQLQLLVPTRRFHEAVMLDVIFIRLRNKKLQLRELGAVSAAATLSLESPVACASR